MRSRTKRIVYSFLLMLALPVSSMSWGTKGHFMVNRLAVEVAPAQLPAFMKAHRSELIYNAYEPDRWREEANTPMNIAQAPDHFFDSEYWGTITTIPGDRYAFMSQLTGKGVDLIKVGYLPYAIMEQYGRLRNAFRNWRNAKTDDDRNAAAANAVVYAGILGHYVGDASMPMHLSIHYNGWADGYPNPKGFTVDRNFHSRYEAAYVDAAIDESAVRSRVKTPQRLVNVFDSVKSFLVQTYSELEPIYEMEKTGEFNPGTARPKGTDIIASELARSATMLSSLWYTAWLESSEPATSPQR